MAVTVLILSLAFVVIYQMTLFPKQGFSTIPDSLLSHFFLQVDILFFSFSVVLLPVGLIPSLLFSSFLNSFVFVKQAVFSAL
jgi:hypothetical protein